MKVAIYSDLHLEFSQFSPPAGSSDLVILAGDIGTKLKGVTWANETFRCPVIYVLGNHEFYGGHLKRTLQKLKDRAAPHVHILENEAITIGDVRFLGTTGWTDFSSTGDVTAASHTAWNWMNDFRMIRVEESYRRIRPEDLIQRNRHAKTWLERELDVPFAGTSVVITHHCPLGAVIGEKHDGHLQAAYTNEWSSLVPRADAWIFGHTHRAIDRGLAGCRFVSNPRGYPGEETGFKPGLTIEL